MTPTRFALFALGALLTVVAAPVGATPVLSPFFFTDRYASNPLSTLPDGDFVQIAAIVDPASTPDPISSLIVAATQGSLTVPLNYQPQVAPIFPGLYSARMPFAGAVTNVGWSISATDSTGSSAPVVAPPIANPVLLPFVTGITVSDASLTPTVSWTLPDLTGLSVDALRIRIIDADTELQLVQADLPTSSTSLVVPGGILAPGESYIYRAILADLETAGRSANQSSAFSDVVTTVPEPGTLVLLAAGLGALSLGGCTRRA